VEVIARTKERLTIADDPDRNGVIYYTSIPWVSFTGGTHPINRPKDPFFDL
jgi:chloramphenicol O-acetyltransferase type A